jgi:hypothetical protein
MSKRYRKPIVFYRSGDGRLLFCSESNRYVTGGCPSFKQNSDFSLTFLYKTRPEVVLLSAL